MVFNLSIAFRDLEVEKVNDDKKKHYAVQLADTILVNKEGRAELATNYPSVFTDVSYYLEVRQFFSLILWLTDRLVDWKRMNKKLHRINQI